MGRDLSQFLEEVQFRVGRDEAGQRLDHILIDKIHWRSRTDLQSRVKRGKVLVNGQSSKPGAKIARDAEITIIVEASDLPDQDPASIPLAILEENADYIALDKQAGIVVHPTGRHVYDTLMNAIFLRYRENGDAARGIEPHVVHRLDRDTSGVILFAKNFDAKRELSLQFENRQTSKTYLALVEGRIERDHGLIDADLGRDDDARIKLQMRVVPQGLASLTRYQVVERFAEHSLVELQPKTGRQHQLRVHLAHIGHPILCDPLYGDPRDLGFSLSEGSVLGRQALHASELMFRPPGSESRRRLSSSLPNDMDRLALGLREGRPLLRLEDRQSARWTSGPDSERRFDLRD